MNSRIARWALELENYNYVIAHRAGTKMSHVDALSRTESDCENILAAIDSENIDFQLQITQSRDQKIINLKID